MGEENTAAREEDREWWKYVTFLPFRIHPMARSGDPLEEWLGGERLHPLGLLLKSVLTSFLQSLQTLKTRILI